MKNSKGKEKSIIDVWGDAKCGDIVCFQHKTNWTKETSYQDVGKPTLAIIVCIDIWDIAAVIHYTECKHFDKCLKYIKPPEILSANNWDEEWKVLGHWNTVPSITELKLALKDKLPLKTLSTCSQS